VFSILVLFAEYTPTRTRAKIRCAIRHVLRDNILATFMQCLKSLAKFCCSLHDGYLTRSCDKTDSII
jgi:hypothetical protein